MGSLKRASFNWCNLYQSQIYMIQTCIKWVHAPQDYKPQILHSSAWAEYQAGTWSHRKSNEVKLSDLGLALSSGGGKQRPLNSTLPSLNCPRRNSYGQWTSWGWAVLMKGCFTLRSSTSGEGVHLSAETWWRCSSGSAGYTCCSINSFSRWYSSLTRGERPSGEKIRAPFETWAGEESVEVT